MTDMNWKDFKDCGIARLELDMMEVRLRYHINVDTHAWQALSCKVDLKTALSDVAKKAPSHCTWAISMDVKNEVSNKIHDQ